MLKNSSIYLILLSFLSIAIISCSGSQGRIPATNGTQCKLEADPIPLEPSESDNAQKTSLDSKLDTDDEKGMPEGRFVYDGSDYFYHNRYNNRMIHIRHTKVGDDFVFTRPCVRNIPIGESFGQLEMEAVTEMQVAHAANDGLDFDLDTRGFNFGYSHETGIVNDVDEDITQNPGISPKDIFLGDLGFYRMGDENSKVYDIRQRNVLVEANQPDFITIDGRQEPTTYTHFRVRYHFCPKEIPEGEVEHLKCKVEEPEDEN